MYVFAHLGAPPTTSKCAKGQLYASGPAYLPGMGAPSPSTGSWMPLAVAGAIGVGLLWFIAKGATPVLEENPSDSWEVWAEKMVTMAEIREPTRTGKQVTRETLETISRETKEPRTKMRADVLLQYGYERWRANPKNPKRTEFKIATRDGGSETRTGYVEGDFATHKERYFWEFTHLPTGTLISSYPVHETKASALAHLHKLATEGPSEATQRLLEKYPGWGGVKDNPSIDPEEIKIGTEHELEHTSSRKVARKIALDHLREDPRYYQKLDELESIGSLFAP